MERLVLTPHHSEIVVNGGASSGAVDLFCYGPELEPAARALGSLYVIGWHQADTSTMGYMVSLIAALARREYYTDPSEAPREAFARTLRKINEVADEFFKSSDVQLAVGIWAVAAGTVMVSKLDKFRILLARDGQVIDILNNVGSFAKEHLEKRQFSSIISGSVQPGDRMLAYCPTKTLASRERHLKTWLLGEDLKGFQDRLAQLGQSQPGFAASFVRVDIAQEAERSTVLMPEPVAPEPPTPQVPAPIAPEEPRAVAEIPTLAWAPRQSRPYGSRIPDSDKSESGHVPAASPRLAAVTPEPAPEPEVPHIIPTEFSLGTRNRRWKRLLQRIRFVRLDRRGKALALGAAVVVILIVALVAKSYLFTSTQERALRAVVSTAQDDVEAAKSKASQNDTSGARQLLMRALTALTGQPGAQSDANARSTLASLTSAMDALDNAQAAQASAIAQLDPQTDRVVLATWASSSQSLWAVTRAADDTLSAVQLGADGSIAKRVALPADTHPNILAECTDGVLVVDTQTRSIVRVSQSTAISYAVPTQDTIRDAFSFADSVYLLTDTGILKVSDLNTKKPVTKQWLASGTTLAADAQRLWIDGSVWVMSSDGTLTVYYKGKRSASMQVPLAPSGEWRLIGGANGTLAVTSPEQLRVYQFSQTDGSLIHTLKLDSQQPLILMAQGPDGSTIAVTKDNRIWKLQ